ncbi:NUDIX domain-containing protein [Nakamurella sp. YIM 132087]|uniref:NUDIX domain-containing protein n=2 Tax=Nakamurella alba TaxID=2665158 RepID=A0A7K1FR33_9ACTN|nr:NUDIX domain-containing protein [Nakamurella alba]
MPGGQTAAREVVEHDRAVAVVAVDGDGPNPDVVLIRQFRHPLRRRLWELPAGLMDVDGEAPLAAVQRELAEETGLAAAHWSVLAEMAASPGFTDEVVMIYLATGLTDIGRQGEIADEEADLEIVRVPLADAVAAVLDGRIVNGAAVAGLLAARMVLSGEATARPGDAGWGAGAPLTAVDAPVGDAPPLGTA